MLIFHIIRALKLLLLSVFGAGMVVALPMAKSEIIYIQTEIAHSAQADDVGFAALAPPTAVSYVATTGGVSAMQGGAFVLHGHETVAVFFGFDRSSIATNRIGNGTSSEWILSHNTRTSFSQDTGITGGHTGNLFHNELYIRGGRVVSERTDPSMPGVTHVEYQIPKVRQDGTPINGDFKNQTFEKTIYDPAVLSNQRVADMSATASRTADFANGARTTQTTIAGYRFQVIVIYQLERLQTHTQFCLRG